MTAEEPVTMPDGETLEELKERRYFEIDEKTCGGIDCGFPFDGKSFSLSKCAQINWAVMNCNRDRYTWPVSIMTIDNQLYSLDLTDMTAFFNASRDAVEAHVGSGAVLKGQIYNAATEAEVNAIVDDR